MADDYPHEHDRYLEELDRRRSTSEQPHGDGRGHRPISRERDSGREPHRDSLPPRDYRDPPRDSREPARDYREPPRDYREPPREPIRHPERYHEREREPYREREPERRGYERDRYDHRGDGDRRRDDRLERGGRGYRGERRRSRSPDRRRSRSPRDQDRDRGYDSRHDNRRDDRRGSRGRGGRRGEESEEEGYGGYRPRKRQQQQPVDKPLPPGAGPAHIADPFYYLRQNVPTDPAEAQRLWLEQQLRSRQMVLQQQAQSAAAASAKTQRELYIGNLVPGAVNDVALRQLFNTTLSAAFTFAAGQEPVVNVNMHSDGRYAFVEFRTSEMASAALALNAQVQLLGQTISVGRPSGYVDPTKALAAAHAAAQALAAFQAGDMAGLAANATAAGMNLAQLGLANLVLKPPGGAEPAAGGAAAVAAEASGGGDSQAMGAQGTGAAAAAQAAAAAALPLGEYDDADQPAEAAGQQGQEVAAAQDAAVAAANGGGDGGAEAEPAASPYLAMTGMVTADILQDDEEYESVVEELRDECNRFAPDSVRAVKVPRPPEPALSEQYVGTANYGKAFVAVDGPAAAQRVRAAIHGRLFAGVTVQVSYISQAEFDAA